MQVRSKREIPEKTRRPMALFGTIPTCENPESVAQFAPSFLDLGYRVLTGVHPTLNIEGLRADKGEANYLKYLRLYEKALQECVFGTKSLSAPSGNFRFSNAEIYTRIRLESNQRSAPSRRSRQHRSKESALMHTATLGECALPLTCVCVGALSRRRRLQDVRQQPRGDEARRIHADPAFPPAW
ncbi:hypothetical protein PR048_015841 [Dryococelus australis]|uniref:Uncharacterized protein n=1 Tax=Dryococelus australis TaxID=614101 RepID=A0ABQ9HI92_9NEOP|nr:hypothetical protein PR048_015841 [Dryococelus australis]